MEVIALEGQLHPPLAHDGIDEGLRIREIIGPVFEQFRSHLQGTAAVHYTHGPPADVVELPEGCFRIAQPGGRFGPHQDKLGQAQQRRMILPIVVLAAVAPRIDQRIAGPGPCIRAQVVPDELRLRQAVEVAGQKQQVICRQPALSLPGVFFSPS